jgi:hypothetical protein
LDQLLEAFDRIVIVHPRGTRGGTQRYGNLLVSPPVLGPQKEDVALQPRQPGDLLPETLLEVAAGEMGIRISCRRDVVVLERDQVATLLGPGAILHQVARDAQQPGAEGRLAPPGIEPAKTVSVAVAAVIGFL